MRLSLNLIIALTFVIAGSLSLIAANASVKLIEETSEIGVRQALDVEALTWAEVEADGLQVTLAGIAPTEALRFRALTAAGSVVDAARVIDEMEVAAAAALAAPRFSAEILRNTSGISMIGLVPLTTDRENLSARLSAMGKGSVTDLLETADYPAPAGWPDALAFAINAIEAMPRAKISVSTGRVAITAITNSAKDKAALENRLRRAVAPGLQLRMDISAPRPVITPFTLRFVKEENATRFDACSADTEENKARILEAARKAGLAGAGRCTVGMGVPSPFWTDAVEMAIAALADIGAGSVTFSNADVTLLAAEGSNQALFDQVIGELESSLPEVFALHANLPQAADPNAGPPEFIATLSPEGQVQLRGRVNDEAMREVTESFAKARFGSDRVYMAARIVADLPSNWPTRVLTGLEALGNLSNGAVTVTPEMVRISGNTGNPDASDEIARLLATELGETARYDINVSYQEALDPVASIPTPDECEARIKAIVADNKINFEPGSATIDATALVTMDSIADVLKICGNLRLEIQGHTDSQGREEMNLSLSQARSESVLNEMRARRVLTSTFTAKGYGEAEPIADNGSEEGREANRRIEFKLIRPEQSPPEQQTTLESVAQSSNTVVTDSGQQDGAGDGAETANGASAQAASETEAGTDAGAGVGADGVGSVNE